MQRSKCRKCGLEFWSYPDRRGTAGKHPKYCSRKCYNEFRANTRKPPKESKQAAAATLIRVPAKFFNDHEERECEPFCDPVKRTDRFVWLAAHDAGLDELLSDARHYSDEWGPDAIGDGGGLKRSAAATVNAIEAARGAR
jgi:hypothetical protein